MPSLAHRLSAQMRTVCTATRTCALVHKETIYILSLSSRVFSEVGNDELGHVRLRAVFGLLEGQ
jgi:hypothetical protein